MNLYVGTRGGIIGAMQHATRRAFLNRTTQTAAAALFGSVAWAAPAASGRIRCGQIGTAHSHASGKMAAMRKFSDLYEVVGVVEANARRRAVAENNAAYRDVPFMTEDQLLNTRGLRMAAVETVTDELAPTGQRCVDAGVHVHLDKPPGRTIAPLRRLLTDAAAKDLTVQLGYMFRYNPAFVFCFNAVREGWVGQVQEVHGVISKKAVGASRPGVAEEPGGTMFELGCHLIDAMASVLGKPRTVTPFTLRTQPDGLADNQLAVFSFERATATIRSSINDPMSNRHFTVVGDGGTVDIRPLEPPAVRLGLENAREGYRRGWQDVPLPKMSGRYDGDMLDLAAVIRGEKAFAFGPEHDLAVHEAVLRASELPLE